MYLHSELYKVIKSKKSLFFISLVILIPFIDLLSNVIQTYLDYWLHSDAYGGSLSTSSIYHPAVASFLSGSSSGHIAQMLLIWMLPIYLMLIYSDSYISDVHCGYHNIIFTKSNRKELLQAKFKLSFYIPFSVCFISLFINYILAQILFWNGTYMKMYIATTMFEKLSLMCPNITYLVYILVYCAIAGGYGVFCSSISYLIPNRMIAYPIVFFVWMFQILAPYSLTYAMQPFIEYGPSHIIPALIIFALIVTSVTLFCYKYKVKHDEI